MCEQYFVVAVQVCWYKIKCAVQQEYSVNIKCSSLILMKLICLNYVVEIYLYLETILQHNLEKEILTTRNKLISFENNLKSFTG